MSDYCIENDLPRQQELEAIRQTKLMRDASYLLPDPGGDVVRQLLDEVDRLKAELQQAHRKGWEQASREAAEVAYEHGCPLYDCRGIISNKITAMEYKG